MVSLHNAHILAINAGSSSIKFSLFKPAPRPELVFKGALSDIGGPGSSFAISGAAADTFVRRFAIPEHVTAVNVLVEWLLGRLPAPELLAIVHRVVYGGPGYAATRAIDHALLDTLYRTASSQPDHLPHEIRLIEALRRHYPEAAQIACFDSGFHAGMPAVAARLPVPRRYDALGIRRHGFHGLACASLMGELARTAGPAAAAGKVVIAHLGGGASVTAVAAGRSHDTSMGLTPAGGIMSGTRSGDLDPGLAWHLAQHHQISAPAFHHMVNHQCGLLGVSDISADMRVLLARQGADSRAAEAVALFCYQARKAVWSMAGAMDGIDTLIFSGGVGERAAEVRARICAGLAHLGVALDAERNGADAAVISTPPSAVCVRVMGADEQAVMAGEACALLGASPAAPGAAP